MFLLIGVIKYIFQLFLEKLHWISLSYAFPQKVQLGRDKI